MQLEAKPVFHEKKKKITKGLYNLDICILVQFSERLFGSRLLEPAGLKGYGGKTGKITPEESSWASRYLSLPNQSKWGSSTAFQKLKNSMENQVAAAASCLKLPDLETSGKSDLQVSSFPLLPKDRPREVSLYRPRFLCSTEKPQELFWFHEQCTSIGSLLLHLSLSVVCKQLANPWGFLISLDWTQLG